MLLKILSDVRIESEDFCHDLFGRELWMETLTDRWICEKWWEVVRGGEHRGEEVVVGNTLFRSGIHRLGKDKFQFLPKAMLLRPHKL
jgi:hypothetical protein